MTDRVLVIGAGGFVGKHLCDFLSKDGSKDIYKTYIKAENEPLIEKDKCFLLNINNYDEVLNIINNVTPDYIIHLAAQASVGLSWEKPAKTFEVNTLGFINLLEAVKATKINPRILAIGSSEQYGAVNESDNPINEDMPLKPQSPYSISKMSQELLADLYCKAYGMDILKVRAFNHIGPGQRDGFVVSDFAKKIVMIEKNMIEPKLYVGNLGARRDFTDVRDIVRAYGMLIENGISGEVYNIGSKQIYKISEILEILKSKSTTNFEVIVDSLKFRPIDVPIIQCDNSKLCTATGWKPEISIEESLDDVLNYWRKNI